jgi:hypothetical protein
VGKYWKRTFGLFEHFGWESQSTQTGWKKAQRRRKARKIAERGKIWQTIAKNVYNYFYSIIAASGKEQEGSYWKAKKKAPLAKELPKTPWTKCHF